MATDSAPFWKRSVRFVWDVVPWALMGLIGAWGITVGIEQNQTLLAVMSTFVAVLSGGAYAQSRKISKLVEQVG